MIAEESKCTKRSVKVNQFDCDLVVRFFNRFPPKIKRKLDAKEVERVTAYRRHPLINQMQKVNFLVEKK